MRLAQLFEMTQAQAVQIFAHLGAKLPASASADDIKKAHRVLVKRYHPDTANGDETTMKQINGAYDMIRNGLSGTSTKPTSSTQDDVDAYWAAARARAKAQQQARDEQPDSTPQWAMAGYSGGMKPQAKIYRNNYTDMNYIMKRMWELSGESHDVWTIWGFDGYFFRGVLSVYGNKSIFNEMAKAMIEWQTKGGNPYSCRAVFITNKHVTDVMWLIYSDGTFYGDDPILFNHESTNANPSNDQQFMRRLPHMLDKLKDRSHATE